MKTKALYVVAPREIEIRNVDIEEPKFDELLIKTKAIGICAWDSYLYQGLEAPGPLPYRIGHEGVGEVIAKGEGVEGFEIGDNIFVGTGGDEMMSEYFNVKYDCVAKIPADEDDFVEWVGEPTVCVVNLINKTAICPGDDIVLVGAGYMGLITLQGLRLASQAGSITVFEIKPERLLLAKGYDPDYAFDPYSEEGMAHAQKIREKGGARIVIDFSTTNEGFELACSLTADIEGKLIIGAWHHHPLSFNAPRWHSSGLTVMNLSPHSNARFKDVTAQTGILMEQGAYAPGRFVTHTAPFGDIKAMNELFCKSIDKSDGYIKGVFTFE